MPIPEELEDGQLLFDHALCHALFTRKKEVPDSLMDWTLEDLVDYHWLLQGEMCRRGFVHKEWDDLDGVAVGRSTIEAVKLTAAQLKAKSLYLPAPHAKMLWNGKKRLIVKCRSYGGMLNKPLYWGDSKHIYGVLKFTDIQSMSVKEFQKLRPQHRVSEAEKRRWWPSSSRLYSYEFDVVSRFKKPQPHVYQRGTQVFFGSPVWKADEADLVVAVDLDGTIADTDFSKPIPEAFLEAEPKKLSQDSLQELNDLATVIIYTGRDPRYYDLTAKWLRKYKVPYDELILGKPVADLYIDDLAMNFDDNWPDVLSTAHAAAQILEEDKQDTLGPGGETAVFVDPIPPEEVLRPVRSEYEIGKSYEIEAGEIILKAAMPKANKPAKRFYDVKKIPNAFKHLDEVLVETKFDGMNMMLSKEKAWSGRGLDKTKRLPYIMAELEKWPHKSFILHGQAQMFTDAEPMHRTAAIGFINGKGPVEEGKNLRITVFDIIELDGRDLSEMPILDRLKLLRKEFKGSPHVPVIEKGHFVVVPPSKLEATCERMAKIKGSEGAMLFDPRSKWQTRKTINFGWGKWKKLKEIDVLVVKKERKEAGWRYLGAIGPISEAQAKTLSPNKVAEMKGKKWVILGHTHVSKINVGEGSILRVQALEIVRNNTYDYSYQNAVPMYPPEKKVPDGLDTAEELAKLVLQKSHSKSKCMATGCDKPPDFEVLWANGKAHAWFCEKDFEAWKKKTYRLMGKTIRYGDDIDRVRKIPGVASEKWSQPPPGAKNIKKQFASDPDSGAQTFMPGRTSEGIPTASPRAEVGALPTLEKIKDPETYDPRKIKDDRVLLDDHRITHAWWSTLQSGRPLKHDKATVKALHDSIVREIKRRNMEHDSPLQKADGGFTYAPSGVIGVPGIGGGERVPDPSDQSFRETVPLQYVRTQERRFVSYVFFRGRDAWKEAEKWRKKAGLIARSLGLQYRIDLDEMENTVVATLTAETDDPKGLQQKLDEILKQLWPAWTGHRAHPKTGKPLPSERKKPISKNLIDDLILLSKASSNLDEFIASCTKQVSGWVKDPKEFCGAFWKDRDQWYHGPVKAGFKDTILQQATTELADWTLHFLGTSAEDTFPRSDCHDAQCRTDKRLNSSAIYSRRGTNLLLDLGSKKLAQRAKKAATKIDGICLTHAHHDHVDGLEFIDEEIPIYMHRAIWRDLLEQKAKLAKELSKREVHLYSSYNAVKIGSSKVRWIPIKHSLKVKTFALRLDGEMIYSPDMLEIENRWLKGITHWIIDGSSLKRDIIREKGGQGYGHQSILNSLKQAAKNNVPQVVVTQIGHTGVKQSDFPDKLTELAEEAEFKGHVVGAIDHMTISGGVKKAEEQELPDAKPGRPYPARFYKGPPWLHNKAYTYIIHHHFPYGPVINKDKTIEEGSASKISITGPGPSKAGGKIPKGALTAPRDPAKAEEYVKREFALNKSEIEKFVRNIKGRWCVTHHTGEPIKCYPGTKEGHAKARRMHFAIMINKAEPDVPFADYKNFADCIRHNQDADNPAAYCASIRRQVQGKSEPEESIFKGVGGFREHWETRQDTGDPRWMIGWTFLTHPWDKTKRFFSGSIKGMCTAKSKIPKKGTKKFARGWLDVQGLRKPVILGGVPGSAERSRSGFLEILEEATFEYGVQRKNLHEYFFHGKLLNGRWIFRLLQLRSGQPRWLAFRSPDQMPLDPVKHADEGYWQLVGETEASVQSPGEEKKPLE